MPLEMLEMKDEAAVAEMIHDLSMSADTHNAALGRLLKLIHFTSQNWLSDEIDRMESSEEIGKIVQAGVEGHIGQIIGLIMGVAREDKKIKILKTTLTLINIEFEGLIKDMEDEEAT